MATVNLGSIKFKWKGTYAGGTAYTIDDVVSYNGSSYICIQASTGNLPTNATYFEQMSSKGTDADLLNIASTAQGDLYYNNGSAIARLGAGTNGQFLKTQGTSANPTWGTVTSNLTDTAWLEYQDATARFRDSQGITGRGTGDRIVVPLNSYLDPYGIINSLSGNQFTVTSTGAYVVDMYYSDHNIGHFKMFLYNDTDSKFAQRPTSALTAGDNYQAPIIGYATGQGQNDNMGDLYYLETGHNYTFRTTQDNSGSFSTTTSQHFGNYTTSGVTSRNTVARVNLTKMSGV